MKQMKQTNIDLTIKCILCKTKHHISVPKEDWLKYEQREDLIQDVFPYLSSGTRELIRSQICSLCFDKIHSKKF